MTPVLSAARLEAWDQRAPRIPLIVPVTREGAHGTEERAHGSSQPMRGLPAVPQLKTIIENKLR
jgi:hypothetical protein